MLKHCFVAIEIPFCWQIVCQSRKFTDRQNDRRVTEASLHRRLIRLHELRGTRRGTSGAKFSSKGLVNFLKDLPQTITKLPPWVMALKFCYVTNPPDMITNSILFLVVPLQFFATNSFAQLY